ncbi:hypothetical protein [Marinoscillum furvescens]|uniref:Uncharacterized protein n=1 Tax=Marinoscillum furvescens DSM 4134 TaxID=1122208 RepID=A0A3D9L3Q4_MARFU|nr:hypothetical protein [Marinoscillum furvescens]RED97904.1 hypothetical protein C7460_11145 [Marinoscillum furvescens DSM 4134]
MFDGADFPKSLDEDVFDAWLEEGRSKKISYNFMLVVWNEFDGKYLPVYAEDRSAFTEYEQYGASNSHESLVAVYDLFSESRVHV